MASKGINFAVAEFENTIAQLVNTSGLPVSVVRLIFQRICGELSEIEKNQASVEQAEFQVALAAEQAKQQEQEYLDEPIAVQESPLPPVTTQ